MLKTFFFSRAHKSFSDCIAGGRPWGTPHKLDTFSIEEIPKGRCELLITNHDRKVSALEKAAKFVDQVPHYLQREYAVWFCCRTCEMGFARRQMNHAKNVVSVQTTGQQYLNRKEIGGCHHISMGFEKGTPSRPFWRRFKHVSFRDIGDAAGRHSLPKIVECDMVLIVTPGSILTRHAQQQCSDLWRNRWSTWYFPHVAPLLNNEITIPAQKCIEGHQACDLVEDFSPERFCFCGQTPTIILREAQPTTSELLLENAVLFYKIVNDGLLEAIDLPGKSPI